MQSHFFFKVCLINAFFNKKISEQRGLGMATKPRKANRVALRLRKRGGAELKVGKKAA